MEVLEKKYFADFSKDEKFIEEIIKKLTTSLMIEFSNIISFRQQFILNLDIKTEYRIRHNEKIISSFQINELLTHDIVKEDEVQMIITVSLKYKKEDL